jgi:hypothetical protein
MAHKIGRCIEYITAIHTLEAGDTFSLTLNSEDSDAYASLLGEDATFCVAELGYTALEAGDGPSGMKVIESEARIDLLITDKLTKEAMGEERMRALLKPTCTLSVARNKRSKMPTTATCRRRPMLRRRLRPKQSGSASSQCSNKTRPSSKPAARHWLNNWLRVLLTVISK